MDNIRPFRPRQAGARAPQLVAESLRDYTALHLVNIDAARLATEPQRVEVASQIVAGWFIQLQMEAESERLTDSERAYFRHVAEAGARHGRPAGIAMHQCVGQLTRAYEQYTARE